MKRPPQKVFVTAMGVISPMGYGADAHLQSIRNGSTHFQKIDLFDASALRCQTAGLVDFPIPPDSWTATKQWQRLDRGGRLLLHATDQALTAAPGIPLDARTLFAVGTSAAAMPLGETFYRAATSPASSKRGQRTLVEHYQAQTSINSIQSILGFRSRSEIISNACASGANAIGHAFHEIRSNRADLALAAGYDALSELVFGGFSSLQALSESGIPRPFDRARDGLAIGEGAATFVLESERSMIEREATPLAEIRGYGIATDLHHLTQPHQEGIAAIASMKMATEQANLIPSDIQYINSHGTGTPLNDIAEAKAIIQWAGIEHSAELMVSSTKSAMGHLLGGAGAVESALCLLALNHRIIPASLNVREPDPACQFDLVREPRHQPIKTVLTNSFGFGGCNATLIFSQP